MSMRSRKVVVSAVTLSLKKRQFFLKICIGKLLTNVSLQESTQSSGNNMKLLMTVCLFLIATSLYAGEVNEEIKNRVAGEAAQQKKIIKLFNEILALKVNQGDKTALQLAKESQDNAGKVIISFERMKELMLKWDSSTAGEFKKLPTKEEKILVVKNQFESLFQKNVEAKNEEALKLAEQGARNGRLDLTVAEMKNYIAKWTAK